MATDTKTKDETIKQITTISQAPREWEIVETKDSKMIEYVSQNHLFKDSFIKGYDGKPTLSVKPGNEKTSFVIEVQDKISLADQKEIVLYKYAREKYFELLFERVSSREKSHVCILRQIKIAKKDRRMERYPTSENPVQAGNFLVAKIDLDIKTALGFSTEVIFSEVDKTLKAKYPRSKIVPLFNRDDLTEEEEVLLKEGLPIFITNTAKMQSSKDFKVIDLEKYYEEEFILEEKIASFRKDLIQSFIYYPIIFKSAKEEVIIGYCYNESQSAPITEGNIEYFEIISYTIKKRIMDSSAATVDVKQNIINFSEQGVLLEITSDYISEALHTKPTFSMDIIFKMMVPMRFSFYVKHIYKKENIVYVGAEITGSNNEEKGFDKYKDIVRTFK